MTTIITNTSKNLGFQWVVSKIMRKTSYPLKSKPNFSACSTSCSVHRFTIISKYCLLFHAPRLFWNTPCSSQNTPPHQNTKHTEAKLHLVNSFSCTVPTHTESDNCDRHSRESENLGFIFVRWLFYMLFCFLDYWTPQWIRKATTCLSQSQFDIQLKSITALCLIIHHLVILSKLEN